MPWADPRTTPIDLDRVTPKFPRNIDPRRAVILSNRFGDPIVFQVGAR